MSKLKCVSVICLKMEVIYNGFLSMSPGTVIALTKQKSPRMLAY